MNREQCCHPAVQIDRVALAHSDRWLVVDDRYSKGNADAGVAVDVQRTGVDLGGSHREERATGRGNGAVLERAVVIEQHVEVHDGTACACIGIHRDVGGWDDAGSLVVRYTDVPEASIRVAGIVAVYFVQIVIAWGQRMVNCTRYFLPDRIPSLEKESAAIAFGVRITIVGAGDGWEGVEMAASTKIGVEGRWGRAAGQRRW